MRRTLGIFGVALSVILVYGVLAQSGWLARESGSKGCGLSAVSGLEGACTRLAVTDDRVSSKGACAAAVKIETKATGEAGPALKATDRSECGKGSCGDVVKAGCSSKAVCCKSSPLKAECTVKSGSTSSDTAACAAKKANCEACPLKANCEAAGVKGPCPRLASGESACTKAAATKGECPKAAAVNGCNKVGATEGACPFEAAAN